jgi:hypothetical protein
MRKILSVCLSVGLFGILSMLSPATTAATTGVGVTPSAVSFGSVTVGNNSFLATVVVTNASRQSVSVLQVSSNLPEFIVSGPSLPLSLPGRGSASFQVLFRPDSATSYSGTINFTTNSKNGGVRSVSVSGIGTSAAAPAPTYLLSPSATSLTFPSTLVGSAYSQPVSLTNTGTGNVSVSQVSYTGSGFSVSGFSGTITLTPGQALSLSATFSPAVVGSASGTLTVVSSATNSTANIALTGTGIQPQITVTPSSASFGSVTVGSNNSQTFKISNPGTAALNLSQALLAGTGFSYSGMTAPLSVAPGGSASFTVSFAPNSATNFSGNLTLMNNSPNSPYVLSFSGTGIASTPQLSVSPTSLNFGSLTTGTSATQTVTLKNTGNANLSISQDSMSGSGFTLSGMALPVTLSAGQSASFSVAFAPTASSSYSGTVTVTSNAVNSPTTITLAGSGAAPVTHAANLSWTPSSSTFAGFDVYRSNVSGGPYSKINPTMVSSTSFSDTNVVVGQTYYYVATEFDSSGNQSAYSNETSALIP